MLLIGGIPALAQDVAATPAYPIAVEQAPAPKHRDRKPAVQRTVASQKPAMHRTVTERKPAAQRTVAARLPAKRPAIPERKPELVGKAVPVPAPAPPPKASAVPNESEPPIKEASLPPKDTGPPEPPITLGGRNQWSMVTDPATGIMLGLPERLLTQSRDTAHGTLWSSPHGEIQLETFKYNEPGLTANKLYERLKRAPNRKIEWGKSSDDSFVFGGMQGLKYFSVRAKEQNGELRGFTLLFDQALEGILEPVVPAMAKAFTPFPQNAAASAPPPPKIIKFGSGIIVSRQGHILTSAGVTDGCDELVANGTDEAERVAAGDGLALLRAPGVEKLTPMAVASADSAGVLTLAGVPDPREQKGGAATRYLAARLTGAALELVRPKPLAGFAGAAALDAQGRLAGVLDMSDPHLAGTGASPLRLIDAKAIRTFLSAHGVDADAQSGEPRSGILRVVCVKK